MTAIESITTANQLLEAEEIGRCELLRGRIIMMSPAGFRHGRIVGTISRILGNFVSQQQLGVVTGAETGFQLAHDPDTVRAPDVAFVRGDRIPQEEPTGFFQGAPDLAVEVVSPGNRVSQLLAKVQQWLEAGCHEVWVVDPETHTVTVYRPGGATRVVRRDESLEGGEVLPAFSVAASDFFA